MVMLALQMRCITLELTQNKHLVHGQSKTAGQRVNCLIRPTRGLICWAFTATPCGGDDVLEFSMGGRRRSLIRFNSEVDIFHTKGFEGNVPSKAHNPQT